MLLCPLICQIQKLLNRQMFIVPIHGFQSGCTLIAAMSDLFHDLSPRYTSIKRQLMLIALSSIILQMQCH